MIDLSGKRRIPPDPAQAALWWVTLRQSDPVRFAEDGRFESWIADPANAAAWNDYDRRLQTIDAFAAMPEIRTMREAALAVIKPRPASRRWFLSGGGLLAASLLAVLLWAEQPAGILTPDRAYRASATVAALRYSTAVGERRNIALSDGSRIALNTGSTVEVYYSTARRDVRLIAGQAFFQVVHNAARPFVVAAGNRTVTATGTAFDVQVEANGRVTVLLVEGHVHVDPIKPTGIARLIPAVARDNLDPGQRFVAAPGAEPVVAIADVDRETAWKRGVFIFRKDRLAEAIDQVNRYSTTQLVIEDRRIDDLTISGVFPTASQQDFVAAITAFYPIAAQREAGGAIALTWRDDARSQVK